MSTTTPFVGHILVVLVLDSGFLDFFATLGHSGLVVFPIDSNDRRKVMIPAPVVTVLTPPDTT